MPEVRILLTFFSPSGYNVRKDYPGADIVTYLPFDTPSAARDFVRMVHPAAAVFIKYEFWGNFLQRIHREHIPLYLISARFDARQAFFKPYGRFMRRLLPLFTLIFTQDGESVSLLRSIGIKRCRAAGDTRFDRVADILKRDNTLPFLETFKDGKKLVVAGSAWEKDEELMEALIAARAGDPGVKYLIAPHDIHPERIRRLCAALPDAVLYSKREGSDLASARVLVLDTVGILTKVYSYADLTLIRGRLYPLRDPQRIGTGRVRPPGAVRTQLCRLHRGDRAERLRGIDGSGRRGGVYRGRRAFSGRPQGLCPQCDGFPGFCAQQCRRHPEDRRGTGGRIDR